MILFGVFGTSKAYNVSCQIVEDKIWFLDSLTINLLTCDIDATINSTHVKISTRNKDVLGLQLSGHTIFYLPVHVNDSFQQLFGYSADECSIESISKDNFKALNSLKVVHLSRNQIEEIANDVFEDLISLEYLVLSKNNFFNR